MKIMAARTMDLMRLEQAGTTFFVHASVHGGGAIDIDACCLWMELRENFALLLSTELRPGVEPIP